MGRSSTVELRFLVPAVGGSNPSVPAIKTERPKPITAQGAFLWASGGIRTRKGADLRKREAFSSVARKERSDAAARGRRRQTRNPSVPHQPRAPHVKQIEPTPPSGGIRTRKDAERRSGARPPQADAVPALGDAPKCRHYRNVPKCRLGTIFEDPPKDCGQKTANMSTVTVVATLFSLIKEDLNEIYSHQGLPLMNT